jgi:hypothetical protein
MKRSAPAAGPVPTLAPSVRSWIKAISFLALKLAESSNKKGTCHAYMVVAPSISSQFHYAKLGQVVSGIRALGFHEVVEAALGADLVSYHEAAELSEKKLLTSSCCPAFVLYIKQAFPELKDKISSNLSPMAAMAAYIKKTDPLAKVFSSVLASPRRPR